MEAPFRTDDNDRIAAFHRHGFALEERQPTLQKVVRVARTLFGAPIAAVSFVDKERQWFIARHGLEVGSTERRVSFCAHAIFLDETLYVEDARVDPRFKNNDLVTGQPSIVTYAGAPVRAPEGYPYGALCVIFNRVRPISVKELGVLEQLADITSELLDCMRQAA
ncbi:MAG: GAF domain-containing protein [Parvularcula sp.]|jgi:GAF domain-containing protein|nr:GAF domain-containing protein [Parvularcula sp.]